MNSKVEYLKASMRVKVKHPFRAINHQFGSVKVRYQGLKKNAAQFVTLFALSNLWMVRSKLQATPKTAVVDGHENAQRPNQIDLHTLGTPAS